MLGNGVGSAKHAVTDDLRLVLHLDRQLIQAFRAPHIERVVGENPRCRTTRSSG
jgi:hypothetical protein